MELTSLLTPVLSALLGALGALCVGLLIQRSQFRRVARNATRAVYIELEGNRLNISMARDYGSYLALSRSAFDRLLPELATWLSALDLRVVAAAYMSHAGYEQARAAPDLTAEMREAALTGIVAAHDAALTLLSRLVFTRAERKGVTPTELKLSSVEGD
jgi:hypothetical protein